MKCICCTNRLENKISNYTYYCDNCDYWCSSLKPNLQSEILNFENSHTENTEIDISHLDAIRLHNFNQLINHFNCFDYPVKPKILDIGCGSGLFVELLLSNGYDALGIEPNATMFKAAESRNIPIRMGFFPDVLSPKEKFEVITLNDVFEHLEHVEELLDNLHKHLTANGRIVINVPNSKGIVFNISKILVKLGISSPWDRLWQKMFYTPHLHYFSYDSLFRLLVKKGFQPVQSNVRLSTITLKGLWKRIGVDKQKHILLRLVYFVSLCCLLPILKLATPDAILITAKR